ncbi:hypothetical protein GPJ56_005953 [Histomonas meleagridis]|uniref:uncharacterized protein n=1 Tax=Histomonas meleagridis TaxID=135588 RepID=UPI00355AC71B|nr:hypothetical protein GPJ56_005953 [Histomonas meleagridis]KAH0799359.1 hypothetical protein GO595_007760 [Histomonas meleagridis]
MEKKTTSIIKKRLPTLKKTGRLSLANEKEFKLLDLAQIHCLSILKILDIRGTYISSIEGLPLLPSIHTFIADNSQISSLLNFSSVSNASKISLKNTPISKSSNYKLAILLVCPNLVSINNTIITESLKKKSQTYPHGTIRKLIDKGWVLEYPCPTQERLQELMEQYHIENEEIIFHEESKSLTDNENEEDIDFDMCIDELRNKQEKMFLEAEHLFDLDDQMLNKSSLDENLEKLFKSNGIMVDLKSNASVEETHQGVHSIVSLTG